MRTFTHFIGIHEHALRTKSSKEEHMSPCYRCFLLYILIYQVLVLTQVQAYVG